MELTYDGAKEMPKEVQVHNLTQGSEGKTYTIKEIKTNDEDMKNFLFTLGCFEGEEVTIITLLKENIVITVKDARYSIDTHLAEAIIVY